MASRCVVLGKVFVETLVGHGVPKDVIDKVAATRELAFQAICGAWPATSLPTSTPSYDWASVTQVLRSVRAI